MDVKAAVSAARQYMADVFAGEQLSPPTLEEVWFDDRTNEWCVTFGLRRGVELSVRDPLGLKSNIHYKTVRVSDRDGKPVSIKVRNPADA